MVKPDLRELADDAGRDKIVKIPESKNGLVVALGNKIYCIEGEKSHHKKHLVTEREGDVSSFGCHGDKLYDGCVDGWIHNTLDDMMIARRESSVRSLCSHEGLLLDAGDYEKIYNTSSNLIYKRRLGSVQTICSHEGYLYDGSMIR